jgi:hypothetical protein
MPPPTGVHHAAPQYTVGAAELVWGCAWGATLACLQVAAWQLEGAGIAQFLVQFGLLWTAVVVPVLLAVNVRRRAPRLALRWQVVILLAIVSTLAAPPWNSVSLY